MTRDRPARRDYTHRRIGLPNRVRTGFVTSGLQGTAETGSRAAVRERLEEVQEVEDVNEPVGVEVGIAERIGAG